MCEHVNLLIQDPSTDGANDTLEYEVETKPLLPRISLKVRSQKP
jgi:hypothetical protein